MARKLYGMLDYATCSLEEIVQFIKARNLPLDNGAVTRSSYRKLIAVLEKADEDRTFDRFMDVSPELRILVYDLHFGSHDPGPTKTPPNDRPPPITRVSRLIRRESLPVLYQRHSIFEIVPDHIKMFRIRSWAPVFSCAPLVVLENVRTLVLHAQDDTGSRLMWWVHFPADGKPYTLEEEHWERGSGLSARADRLTAKLRSFFDERQRESRFMLKREDEAFFRGFEELDSDSS